LKSVDYVAIYFYDLVVRQVGEEFPNGFGKMWQSEFRTDIDQGLEHEAAAGDLGMGYDKVGFRKRNVAVVKQIDVDCAGAVSLLGGRAAKVPFDSLERVEKFLRLHFDGKFERSVEERLRFRRTVHRRSFVNLRAENRLRSGVESEEAPTRCLEVHEAGLNIGSECDSGAHGFSDRRGG
jgi:hypothetical protein